MDDKRVERYIRLMDLGQLLLWSLVFFGIAFIIFFDGSFMAWFYAPFAARRVGRAWDGWLRSLGI